MDLKDSPEYKQVVEFDRQVRCIPEWEEIREVEFVRQSGKINMITDNLERYCFDHGLLNAVSWIDRCRKNRMFWGSMYERVLSQYEVDHGPRDTWFIDGQDSDLENVSIFAEILRREAEIKALKRRRSRAVRRK